MVGAVETVYVDIGCIGYLPGRDPGIINFIDGHIRSESIRVVKPPNCRKQLSQGGLLCPSGVLIALVCGCSQRESVVAKARDVIRILKQH